MVKSIGWLVALAAVVVVAAGCEMEEPAPEQGRGEAVQAVMGDQWPFLDSIARVDFYCTKEGGVNLSVDEPAGKAGVYAFNGTARGTGEHPDSDGITKKGADVSQVMDRARDYCGLK